MQAHTKIHIGGKREVCQTRLSRQGREFDDGKTIEWYGCLAQVGQRQLCVRWLDQWSGLYRLFPQQDHPMSQPQGERDQSLWSGKMKREKIASA